YIEGFERFGLNGQLTECVPKGMEIRTTVHPSIGGAIAELEQSFARLRSIASPRGFEPVLISYNPFRPGFIPVPPLNEYELKRRQQSPEKQTAHLPMMTFGPDLNLSVKGMHAKELVDTGMKLTAYSPFIVPFSFSSPFYRGKLWEGLSVRTFFRTGARPAALVFLERKEDLIQSCPSLTKPARLESETGRIEFKACDSVDDFRIYAGLLALLKGLVRDQSLKLRSLTPDAPLHQLSAREGFSDPSIRSGARELLRAAAVHLSHSECALLSPLAEMLAHKQSPAHAIRARYKGGSSIEEVLRQSYEGYKAMELECASFD
ncbi:MAG: glutamate--cysteine ligase, partial [Candidatus Omnitrophica bacterium]|nr:glutamate--cysteine ligase [Candidatus Omnitrophota bacterium]